jgi:glutamate racemase
MIEEGWLDHQALKLTVHEYVAPYLMLKPGIALLACTHYPWIKKTFQEMLPGWTILDSAHAVADIAEKTLKLSQGDRPALITWYFSDPEAVASTMIDSEPHRF